MKYLKKFESIQHNKFISVEEKYPDESDGECFLVKFNGLGRDHPAGGDSTPSFLIRVNKKFYCGGFEVKNFSDWMSIDYIIEEINDYFLYIEDNFGNGFESFKFITSGKLFLSYKGIEITLDQKEEFLNYCFKLSKLLLKLYNCGISFKIKDDDGWYKQLSLEGLNDIINNSNFKYKIKMKITLDEKFINSL